MKKRLYFVLFVLASCLQHTKAQEIAIKSNIVYDLTATINLGAEYVVAPQWTIELSGNYNNWTFSHQRKWKHWFFQPELRYWLEGSLKGHFVGLQMQGGKHNIGNLKNGLHFLGTDFSKLSDDRYQGWFVGTGVTYGYAWRLHNHWSIETEVGIGYNYTRNDHYPCATCGERIESNKTHHYFGLTELAFNVVYLF